MPQPVVETFERYAVVVDERRFAADARAGRSLFVRFKQAIGLKRELTEHITNTMRVARVRVTIEELPR